MASLTLNVDDIVALYHQLSEEEQDVFRTRINQTPVANNKLQTIKDWLTSMGNIITEFTIDGLDVLKIECIDQPVEIRGNNKYGIYHKYYDVGSNNQPKSSRGSYHWQGWDNSPYKSGENGFDKNTPFEELVPCLKDTDSHFVYQYTKGSKIYIKKISLDMVLDKLNELMNGGGQPKATFNSCTIWIVL